MLLWMLLEIVVILLFVVVGVTQVLIPLYRGSALFPAIRARQLKQKITRLRQTQLDEELVAETERLQQLLSILQITHNQVKEETSDGTEKDHSISDHGDSSGRGPDQSG